MNAKTTIVSDVRELLLNSEFDEWTLDDPDNWPVTYESPPDAEVSEVGSGEGHGGVGSGYCNLYGILGTSIYFFQILNTLVIGKKYKVTIKVNTLVNGGCYVYENNHTQWPIKTIESQGTYTWVFTATHTDIDIQIIKFNALTDITFEFISIKPVRQIRHI